MPNSQNYHLYAFKVVFTKEILGAPVMPPGEFGPALEKSNWTLLNDQSLNVAAVLLFFLHFLPCLNCFHASQSIHLLFLQALRDLFDSMDKTSSSIPPIILLQFLHMAFPQFAEKGDQGQYLQQVKTSFELIASNSVVCWKLRTRTFEDFPSLVKIITSSKGGCFFCRKVV